MYLQRTIARDPLIVPTKKGGHVDVSTMSFIHVRIVPSRWRLHQAAPSSQYATINNEQAALDAYYFNNSKYQPYPTLLNLVIFNK